MFRATTSLRRLATDHVATNYGNYQIRQHKIGLFFTIVGKGEQAYIERFGKLSRTADPGLHWTIPLIDTIRVVSLREMAVPIDPQSSVTKDNVQVKTSGAVYFKVVDPLKACYETYDLLNNIVTHSQSSMRSAVGLIDLDTLFHDRNALNTQILVGMKNAAKDWGVDVLRYEITEVSPDARVSEAMDAQSIAERKRRETLLNAEAQRQHDITVSEGHKQATINNAEAEKFKIVCEAESNKQRVILEAEANKEKILMEAKAIAARIVMTAHAEAEALDRIANVLPPNYDVGQYSLAKDYLDNVANKVPGSTVFMPHDITDVAKLVTMATTANRAI